MKHGISLTLWLAGLGVVVNAQESNTECNIGPNALTDAYGGYDVPRTCFPFGDADERCFYTLVPPCAAGKEVPLVVDPHGVGMCPLYQSGMAGWGSKAFEECFVVVWPSGNMDPKVGDFPCWALPGGADYESITGMDCCCAKESNPFYEAKPTDPDFLRATIEGVVDFFNNPANGNETGLTTIDTKRIYMAGYSNGCMSSLSVAALHSDIVAAVCCHAGTLLTPFAKDYVPVPTWLVHGGLDATVPIDGANLFLGYGFPPPPEVANRIADKNGCDVDVVESDVTDNSTAVAGTSYKRSSNCKNNATVELVVLPRSGHMPFLGAEEAEGLEGSINTAVDTTSMAWEFCSSHSKASIPPVFAGGKTEEDGSSANHHVSSLSLISISLLCMLLFDY